MPLPVAVFIHLSMNRIANCLGFFFNLFLSIIDFFFHAINTEYGDDPVAQQITHQSTDQGILHCGGGGGGRLFLLQYTPYNAIFLKFM